MLIPISLTAFAECDRGHCWPNFRRNDFLDKQAQETLPVFFPGFGKTASVAGGQMLR